MIKVDSPQKHGTNALESIICFVIRL